MHKKRGTPRGNRNAYKHGFYSAAFTDHERRALDRIPLADLAGEIELIRVANFRFLEALKASAAPLDIETQLAALRAVNLSAQSITGLLRAQMLTPAADGPDEIQAFWDRLDAPPPDDAPDSDLEAPPADDAPLEALDRAQQQSEIGNPKS